MSISNISFAILLLGLSIDASAAQKEDPDCSATRAAIEEVMLAYNKNDLPDPVAAMRLEDVPLPCLISTLEEKAGQMSFLQEYLAAYLLYQNEASKNPDGARLLAELTKSVNPDAVRYAVRGLVLVSGNDAPATSDLLCDMLAKREEPLVINSVMMTLNMLLRRNGSVAASEPCITRVLNLFQDLETPEGTRNAAAGVLLTQMDPASWTELMRKESSENRYAALGALGSIGGVMDPERFPTEESREIFRQFWIFCIEQNDPELITLAFQVFLLMLGPDVETDTPKQRVINLQLRDALVALQSRHINDEISSVTSEALTYISPEGIFKVPPRQN